MSDRIVRHLEKVNKHREFLARSKPITPTAAAMVRIGAELNKLADLFGDARSELTSGRFEKLQGAGDLAKGLSTNEALARQAAERVDNWLAEPDFADRRSRWLS